jgi:hypothetical protein
MPLNLADLLPKVASFFSNESNASTSDLVVPPDMLTDHITAKATT